MKPNASIIIPNYEGSDLLQKNLPYVVAAMNNVKNRILEVIIVDDASKDASVKIVKDKFPQIRIVQHKINRGFTSSVNTGVRSSKGEFVVLLNTDVIPEKHFMESIYTHFEDESVFGVSLHEKGYGWAKAKFENGFINHSPGKESKTAKNTFWISGGSGVFRRDLWIQLGGFDEKIFKFYWDDVDLSYRAAKRGMKLVWDPKSNVVHAHESTTAKVFSKGKLEKMQEVNQLKFIWKNLTSQNMFRKHIIGLLGRIARHPGYLRVVLATLLKVRDISKARKKEKKQCKVSDEAIFARF